MAVVGRIARAHGIRGQVVVNLETDFPEERFQPGAELFIERCAVLLRPGGRFYLVTKQPDSVGPVVADHFGTTEVVERRGYIILCARRL